MDNHLVTGFGETLAVLQEGTLVQDLSEEQKKIILELQDAIIDGAKKAKGSLTIKLDYLLEDGVINILPDIKSTVPKRPRLKSVLWAGENGALSRVNPRQFNMFDDATKRGSKNIA